MLIDEEQIKLLLTDHLIMIEDPMTSMITSMIQDIRRLQALFVLFALTLMLASCTSREVPIKEAAFQIPALKPRMVALSPNEAKVYRGKYDELSQKITSSPSDPKAYVEMAQLFMNEARITGDHPYYYPAAKQLLDRALQLDANNFNALISMGSIQLSLHQFSDAAITGRKAIAASPYSNYPWGILCDASVELGDYKTAIMAADSMVALRPDLRSYARVSYLRELHGDIPGAIEAMDLAVKAGAPGKEEKAWARHTLGSMYLNHGDLKRAENEFTMALLERPNYAFALGGLAKVRAAQQKYDVAIHLLDSASALVPEFSFLQLKADILHVQGKQDEERTVIAEIEKMLAEDEASGHGMDREFAMLYATRGIKTDKAEAYARKEFAKRPNSVDAQFSLAIACYRAGKLGEAESMINKVMQLRGKNAEHFAYAGLIADQKGDKVNGARLMKEALSINPSLTPLLQAEIKQRMHS